jgi:hypothetical protein
MWRGLLLELDTQGAVIGSQLVAYFPEKQKLQRKWAGLQEAVNRCFRLSAPDDPERKQMHMRKLRSALKHAGEEEPPNINFDFLGTAQWNEEWGSFGSAFEDEFEALSQWLQGRIGELARDLMRSELPTFR